MRILVGTWVLLLAGNTVGFAQSSIDPTMPFAWTENHGWINWHPNATDGVVIHESFLSGWIWGENLGWINLGDGSPGDVMGIHYTNTTATDFGVNIDPATGDLFGYGWGENVGWVNFDVSAVLPAGTQRARYDACSNRLVGWAWGENMGWINLDDPMYFVAVDPMMVSDCDGDGLADACEIQSGAEADCDSDGVIDSDACCKADVNNDGTVDPLDVGFVAARLSCTLGAGDPACDAADVNCDGVVDPLDMGYVLSRFGPC